MNAIDVVKKLNELVEIDKDALSALVSHRVKFDGKLASSEIKFMAGQDLKMGVIGLLNGLIDDGYLITASGEIMDDGSFDLHHFDCIDIRTCEGV
ncbi:hypothetical protein GTU35_001220 [Vibrio fluvialis]|nr:hypothetical protein [Vibrio fluvialis]